MRNNNDDEGPNFLSNIYVSPTGAEVEIVKVENTALYAVQFVNGGAKPAEFNGMFTGSKLCREAIDAYFRRVQAELDRKATEAEEALAIEAETADLTDEEETVQIKAEIVKPAPKKQVANKKKAS